LITLAKGPFCIQVRIEVAGLNSANGSGLFQGFPGGGFAGSQLWVKTSLREGPLPSAGIHQEKFDGCPPDAIADGCHLGGLECVAGRFCHQFDNRTSRWIHRRGGIIAQLLLQCLPYRHPQSNRKTLSNYFIIF
jgi:hypothetical protein